MESLDNYVEYRKHKPEYKAWKEDTDNKEAKRIGYIKENNVSEAQKQADIKRAKAVLNAVNVMDEFSQTRAEDMEVTTEAAVQPIVNLLTEVLGVVIIGLSALSKRIRTAGAELLSKGMKAVNIKNIAPLLVPLSALIIGSGFIYGKASAWGAKKEMQASREGRREAIDTDLKSANNFAVLTDEQEKEVEEIAKTIKIDKKEAKKADNANKRSLGIVNAFKTLFRDEDAIKIEHFKEKKKVLKDNENVQLSQKDIEEAKKDQQLISNIVEKIDIQSQEYAENVELATGTIQAVAFGAGGGVGAIVNKVLKNFKFKDPITPKLIACVSIFVIPILYSIAATKVQKQASRVARFKAKQEFMKNPEKIIYVEDEKAKDVDGSKYKAKKENKNFFKFIVEVFKNNAEYENYKKENNIKNLQRAKALEQIKLTEAQEKRANQLRNNVIMTFNEVDENSQKYSESTEALGQTVSSVVNGVSSIFIMPFMLKISKTIMEGKKKGIIGNAIGILIPILASVFANIYITKEQKNASRVADMMALRQLGDYKNYVDYSNLSKDEVNINNEVLKEANYEGHSDLFKKFMQNRNKNN